ncbi:MAG: ATP-binding protein [Alphaproteobacteria bacterium]|nr:ATP-binding protein [Alphaproteobacteria bacterium]
MAASPTNSPPGNPARRRPSGRCARIAAGIDRQARRLAALANAADAARRSSETILDSLPDPLLLFGEDRTLYRSNAAARAAFGGEMAAVLRHPLLRGAIDRAFATKAPQTADVTLPVPVAREVQATVILLDPVLADGTAALVVLSDRTRERAVERMRSDFVTNASHELRTPLASVIGFIDTLRGPAADDVPAQRRFLGIMAEQAARMHRLIDDLLSLSRIELTEHQPPADRVDLVKLIRSVAAGFEPRLAGRLRLDIAEGLPAVTGDADQLAQVLGNLIDNAAKYGGEAGEVRVSLGPPAGTRWPARPGVLIAVSDDGPGIPRADLPRLTERFYRVDKARSRGVGGTGLGLAIVKHIINRHRGQLAIDSEEGRGSMFSVWLPAAEG